MSMSSVTSTFNPFMMRYRPAPIAITPTKPMSHRPAVCCMRRPVMSVTFWLPFAFAAGVRAKQIAVTRTWCR